MKILYDATPLLMRSAGVKNYHYELLRRLLELAPRGDLALFPWLDALTPNYNQRSNYPAFGTAVRLGAVLASNYLRLPLGELASRGCDLFHVTHHLWHPPLSAALTSMVHDPTPLTMPECHTASNIRYFERFAERTLPRLAGVATPSNAVKRDLAELLGAPPEKIAVIPHGVDPRFFEAPGPSGALHHSYGLPPGYVLFVGSLEPRKNLERLAAAHSGLPPSLRREHPLLIAGTAGWKNDAIRRVLKGNPDVRVAGYVEPGRLPAVYAQASVFAFPSLYEGFGMPLLEAMAAGAPVLTSNVSAMPEVAGGCGVLADPLDVESIREGLRSLLEDPARAKNLAQRGRERAAEFTWELCARRTLSFLESCAAGTR